MVGEAGLNTITSNVQVFVFPLPSFARTVTRVLPSGKALPLAGVLVTGTEPAQASVALAEKVTMALFDGEQMTTLVGQVITGARVSRTITLRVAVAELP